MTPGQVLALEQIRRVADHGSAVEMVTVREPTDESQCLLVELSLYCGDMHRVEAGLPIRDRERVTIWIGPDFPYDIPCATVVHRRFSGYPHVNWGCVLCLYQAPQTEWSPRNGMFGLLGRLALWFRQAALDELDPTGGPLHPPVTYSADGSLMIPRVDAPVGDGELWFGWAKLSQVSANRIDIVGWSCENDSTHSDLVGAAILLDRPMPLEFPEKLGTLIHCLEERGVPLEAVFALIRSTLRRNPSGDSLYVVLGTPMRGIRGQGLRQHLTGWRVDSFVEDVIKLESNVAETEATAGELGADAIEQESAAIRERVVALFRRWAENADVTWCRMREDRPEITTRRDVERPASWFAGRTVEIWGCGALGGYIAEWIVRAGVSRVVLRDNGTVTPGVLVRQPYTDADIGEPKAEVLAERLRAINPNCEITVFTDDILRAPLADGSLGDDVDLTIDATASNLVLARSEEVWKRRPEARRLIASVAIDRHAERLLLALATERHSGGTLDVIRSLKLAACRDATLGPYADAFFPDPPPPPFQPEPGCSDATFVGSAADTALLSAAAVNSLGTLLQQEDGGSTAHGCFLSSPNSAGREPQRKQVSFDAGLVIHDPGTGFETRISAEAWRSIRAWQDESERQRGAELETGGLLFGELDEHLEIVWVSEVSGPPPDSEHSAEEFVCGIVGTSELNAEKAARTRKSVQYVGTWHTHPVSSAQPSGRDLSAVDRLLTRAEMPSEQMLLLIVGYASLEPEIAATVFLREEFESLRRRGLMVRAIAQAKLDEDAGESRHRIGISLSGGGSRAIAFHLGCLRTMHDRGVLSRADVVSSVSGGSVIGAMYAYSDLPFTEFENWVRSTLRRGFSRGIARRTFFSPRLFQVIGTKAVAGLAANLAFAARIALGQVERLLPSKSKAGGTYSRYVQPPFPRWVSRTTAFEQTLRDLVFGDAQLPDVQRNGLHTVINACELRTGTAFRFGSRESGCWRYGVIDENNVSVATAVAASAAYPALLPAIDRHFGFRRRETRVRERVILTDGGVYENLGVTCMMPGRDPAVSTNVFSPNCIICCDAGPGQFGDAVLPYGWPTRMARSFETTHRQVQHGLQKQLHMWRASGELDGFVYAYLGQQDHRLPYRPPDFVSRDSVINYPTDFSPMPEGDIDLLSKRGEQLARLLIEHYCPEL